VCPDVPQEIDDAIASALEIDPAKRCPSALELRKRLLDAWARISPIADAVEVGEYVRALVSGKLDKRREQATAVLALREKISHVSERAIELALRDGFDSASLPESRAVNATASLASQQLADAATVPLAIRSTASLETEATPERSSHRLQSHPAPRWKRPVVGALLAGVAALAVASLAAWRMKADDAPHAKVHSPDAVPLASGPKASVAHATGQGDASAADASVPAKSRAVLIVRSDVPMTGLQIGGRTMAFVTPTREIDLHLADQERAVDLELTATAHDGRRATTRVTASDVAVEVRFPAPSKARPSSTPKTTGKKPPGLAPTPYEK
jgi:hypothetical protein